MRLERYRSVSGQPITRDYIANYAAVASLYEYNPWEAQSEEARADWLDREDRPQADRAALVRVLREYNARIGNNSAAASELLDALEDKRTLVVVGGQQAGLFTGPLLVLYKAITIINEAKTAAARLGRKVVPVFWIAGEDHDVDEVNHTYILTDSLSVQKIKLNAAPETKCSVSRWNVPAEAWDDAIAQLDQTLMNTEFKPELIERLRSICADSSTLSDQFAKIIAWLMGEYGLLLVDSDDPALRKLESGLFRSIVERNAELSDTLMAAKQRLESFGYKAQTELAPEQAHLFVFHNGERLLLGRGEDGFSDRKGTVRLSEDELAQLAASEPERLSNNVMTRPLMQDYLFPVLSTVLGPSEIAYWGLLRSAFELYGLRMPIIVPRYEFTLLEGTIQKQMTKYGLDFDDVVKRLAEKQSAWLEAQGSLQVDQLFEEAKEQFEQLYNPVVEAVSGLNPGLRKLAETNKQKIAEQMAFLQARAGDAFRSQHDSALRQWERIRLSVLPQGKPQERVYNGFQYLAKYGHSWLGELLESPLERDGIHRIVYF